MAVQIQLRRDTAANWASTNPVLAQGEAGLATDTKDLKFGDGTTAWNSLTPWSPNTVNETAKLVSIGDQGFAAIGFLSSPASTAGTSEMMFTVGVAATNISALFCHSYNPPATPWVDTDPSGPISFSASLRVVSSTNPGTVTGTLYRLTFGGRTTATLDPGGRIITDDLGLSLAAGDIVAVRTYLSSGTAYPPHETYGSIWAGWGGFTATSDLTAPGSGSVAATSGYYYGPAALLGFAGSSRAKSVLLLGDSIGAAQGDQAVITNPALSLGGFAVRALSGKAGLINAAIPGDRASLFYGTNGSFRRLSNAGSLYNSAIIQYGINDIIVGDTAATVEAHNLDIATYLGRMGVSKIFLTTLLPNGTSTDGWATTANQTPLAQESQRVAYNNWVRANCPIDPSTKAPVAVGTSGALLAGQFGHPITAFFDTCSKVESSLNSGLWLPANRVVTDGAITSGAATLTSSTANFVNSIQESGGDRGTAVIIRGAGASGADLQCDISSVTSSTQALMNANAGTTVTGAQVNIGIMTVDGHHPSPHGAYLVAQAINTALL